VKLRRKRPGLSVPVDAMADLAFLLLVFIMLVSILERTKQNPTLEYPSADNASPVNAPLEIAINPNGGIFLDGERASFEELESSLGKLYRTSQPPVMLLADQKTAFAPVKKVLALLQKLEYRRLNLAVKRAAE
jgi:biopolymer transport protein ExbD